MPLTPPTDPVALVEWLATGDVNQRDAARPALGHLLTTDADLRAAALLAAAHLGEHSGPSLCTLLAVVDRHPPADWAARIDALFTTVKKAKRAGDRRRAAFLLCAIGGSNRWAAPLKNLHPPDLWPRLWAFADSSDRRISADVSEGIAFGLRACPDRALAERFLIDQKLPHLAVNWAWMGEDVRGIMDRLFAAGVESRELASDVTIVYELQNGRPSVAVELFDRLEDSRKVTTAQNLAVYGKRLTPVAAVVEWVGGLLALKHAGTRYKAAQAACERAAAKQDIGPILPHLGRVLDTAPKVTGDDGQAVWWAAAALGITSTHLPQHRAAALAELTARLTDKVVARRGAGFGLAIARMMDRDLIAVGELFADADEKVCAGALDGFMSAYHHLHLPRNMHDFRDLVKPLVPALRKLAGDPRKDVARAATAAVREM